jgi:hypothetical protein
LHSNTTSASKRTHGYSLMAWLWIFLTGHA